jgi:hypothetical protein
MIGAHSELVLQEIVGLCPRTVAIIDSERTSARDPLAPERHAFQELCRRLHIRCCVLDRRAIENYFTEQSVRSEYGTSATALGDFGALPPNWKKESNWRVARWMTRDDLTDTDLGRFLDDL